jgi:hypothetical protein
MTKVKSTIEFNLHQPPKDHHYKVTQHNKTFNAVWLIHPPNKYNYTDDQVQTIWGFIDRKSGAIHSPVNSKKPGTIIDPSLTTKWTAMHPPKLNPLEMIFSM